MKKILSFTIVLATITFAKAQTMGTMTDPRDGNTYETVTIDVKLEDGVKASMTWMAENLNFIMEGAYSYNDSEENAGKLGRLYTWQAAMKACPLGWHLPSDRDWAILENHFGGKESAAYALLSNSGWRKPEMNGTNSSGFNAIGGGHRTPEGGYENVSNLGYWWTSTSEGSDESKTRILNPNILSHYKGVVEIDFQRDNAFSCRCLKD